MWSEFFFILNVLIDVSIWHFEICESVLWDYKVFFLEEKSMMPERLHLYLCIWQVLLSKVSYIAFKLYIWTVNTLRVNQTHDLGIAFIYSLSCMQECCLQLTTVILKRLCFFSFLCEAINYNISLMVFTFVQNSFLFSCWPTAWIQKYILCCLDFSLKWSSSAGSWSKRKKERKKWERNQAFVDIHGAKGLLTFAEVIGK